MPDAPPSITGLHHVTAITADAQKNVDFYAGTLGLRLVKRTVNFDDPSSYHLYYGDETGTPGGIMTFFAWPGAHRGRHGTGQVTVTAFSVPAASLPFWKRRLAEAKVAVDEAGQRLGEPVLALADPDGMRLELIGVAADARPPYRAGTVPAEHAIRGFHSVTIAEEGYERTARLLSDTMGFRLLGSDDNRFRYAAAGAGAPGAMVDVLCQPDAMHGTMGAGAVHHVAWRTPSDEQQAAWRRLIAGVGLNVSPVMDRTYFHSIYYREPGGVLFEIATDSPGFAVDEPPSELGTKLMLPARYEPLREKLEQFLPPLRVPG